LDTCQANATKDRRQLDQSLVSLSYLKTKELYLL